MKQAKVYFTDFRMRNDDNHQTKLRRLMEAAGMDQIDFRDKFVAIKIHFGELGNLAFLRPNFAHYVADYVKELGGKPFLTDCNTLYVGSRKNALDHLDTANLILYGKANPVDALEVFGAYVRSLHAKDGLYPTSGLELGREVPLGTGKVDFYALFRKLRNLGYEGPVTIEREIEGDQQLADILSARDYLQTVILDVYGG